MKIHSRRIEAREFVREWATAPNRTGQIKEQRRLLDELGPNPDPDDVNRIVEYDVCLVHCDECGRPANPVVAIDVSDGEHDFPTYMCEGCLVQALGLIREYKRGPAS
jgi:uncharacterized protein YuzB (UPF0349 family)